MSRGHPLAGTLGGHPLAGTLTGTLAGTYGHSATLQRPPSRHKASNLGVQQSLAGSRLSMGLSACSSLPRRQASVPSSAPSIPPLPYSQPPSYGGVADSPRDNSAIYSELSISSGTGTLTGTGSSRRGPSRRNYSNHHKAPPSYSEHADLDMALADHAAVLKFHDVGQEIDV